MSLQIELEQFERVASRQTLFYTDNFMCDKIYNLSTFINLVLKTTRVHDVGFIFNKNQSQRRDNNFTSNILFTSILLYYCISLIFYI